MKHRPDDPLEFLVHNLTEKDDKDKQQNKTKEIKTQSKASDTWVVGSSPLEILWEMTSFLWNIINTFMNYELSVKFLKITT